MAYELPPDGEAVKQKLLKLQASSERYHKRYRGAWDHLYSLYRSHKALRRWYAQATPTERDSALHDLQRQVGAELFIPRSFETVETIIPKAVSHRPTMLILPRRDTPEENCEAMRITIGSQQEQVDYEMTMEETLKSGVIYGLGVEKHLWRSEMFKVPVAVERSPYGTPMMRNGDGRMEVGHDDPDAVNVDIFDWFWDSYASEARQLRWCIHRTWRDTAYVVKMMLSGAWNNPYGVPTDELEFGGGGMKHFSDSHHQRLADAGLDVAPAGEETRHEVWEFHDGMSVITMLNREWPVQVAPLDFPLNRVPFTTYRPTTQGIKQLPGIGAIEPIEHLNLEENAFRTLRMDNARYAVNNVVAYMEGAIDRDDIKIGPGVWLPFKYGDPRDAVFPLPVAQDVPAFAYNEMEALKQDIDRVTGLSDVTYGASSEGETATGVQIIQAAANARIQKMARRLSTEAVIAGGRMWLAMNQWKIRTNRTVTVPWVPEMGGPERKWAQRQVTPESLAGEMFVTVEDTEQTQSPAEKQQLATNLMNMFRGDNTIEQRHLYTKVLKLLGERAPESWLAPEGPSAEALMMVLEQIGVSREQIAQIAEMAMQLQEQDQSPQGEQQALPAG